MRHYRRGFYGIQEYLRRRERDQAAKQAKLEVARADLDAEYEALVQEFPGMDGLMGGGRPEPTQQ